MEEQIKASGLGVQRFIENNHLYKCKNPLIAFLMFSEFITRFLKDERRDHDKKIDIEESLMDMRYSIESTNGVEILENSDVRDFKGIMLTPDYKIAFVYANARKSDNIELVYYENREFDYFEITRKLPEGTEKEKLVRSGV